ncbi:MAG: nucleotide exchange factor GrpE [Candidatus Thermoplasmatota archaeon]|nr:nucleotide exchange factor GrpE [Candidatus Thermoplasmatota archaeon]
MSTTQSTGKKKGECKKSIASLEKQITQLKKELQEKNEKLLRSCADFQNYQKRMEKEVQAVKEETKNIYLSELLDLTELLKKAYEDHEPKKGLELMLKNIEQFFAKECISPIDCMGKKFDHHLHHAITTIEKDDGEDDIVVEEVKKGYLVRDKLLRPAHVIVAKKKEQKE